MATRRMFSMEIVDSDAFLNMPLSTQSLYFHLGMRADDDGVVNNYRSIQKILGSSEDDLKLLVAKRFILPLNDGELIVIKHWKINNYIQKDRYVPSKYKKELALLGFDENKAYKFLDTECIQNGYTGKVSIGKDSIGKISKDKSNNIDTKVTIVEETKVITDNPNHTDEGHDDDDELF